MLPLDLYGNVLIAMSRALECHVLPELSGAARRQVKVIMTSLTDLARGLTRDSDVAASADSQDVAVDGYPAVKLSRRNPSLARSVGSRPDWTSIESDAAAEIRELLEMSVRLTELQTTGGSGDGGGDFGDE